MLETVRQFKQALGLYLSYTPPKRKALKTPTEAENYLEPDGVYKTGSHSPERRP